MNIELEHIRGYFKNDKFATKNGMVIDSVTPDGVVCSMQLNAAHQNAAGGIQGGAIFTLADLTFAVHSNLDALCGADVGVTVAQSCNIIFLKSTKGSRLIAKSTRLSKGRNISVYRIRVEDDLGTAVAEMTANGFTTPKLKTT